MDIFHSCVKTILHLEDESTSHDVGDDEAECQPDGHVSLGVVLRQVLMKGSVFDEAQNSSFLFGHSQARRRCLHKHVFSL